MFDYDVIVVGCGPAGLMAVAELKEKGIDVLGIDKKPRLDVNLRSASGFFVDGQRMNGEYIQLEPLKEKIYDHYDKTTFGEPDLSRRLLTPNGRLWDLVLTGKEVEEGRDEVLRIEQTLGRWKVVKK